MKLPFPQKKKFILIIGDDGAVLSLFNKGNIEQRLFAVSPSMLDRKDMNTTFLQNPDIPIYVMIDTMEQSYTKQTLPAVSSFAIQKLVTKRLERDFAQSDIKGAILLGRDSDGRRDWIYMFAAAPVSSSMSEWIDYISSLDNKFAGIYMLPVEMQNFAKVFNKKAPKTNSLKTDWQFIVTHNKTGGFRQVILHEGKVVFTRLIKSGKDNLPEIIAGNIEQEVLNTIDYLRRLSFGDDDEIEVSIIASKEIKKSLKDTKIRGNNINVFTPFEISESMGMKGVAGEDDKFSDLIISANFATSTAILKLDNPKIRDVNNLLAAYNISNLIFITLLPLLVLYAGYLIYSISDINKQIQAGENEQTGIETKWSQATKNNEFNIDEANKITDFIEINKLLTTKPSPLEIIRKIPAAQENNAYTKSISWVSQEKGDSTSIDSNINLQFYNNGENIEQLFTNFDNFRTSVKNHFSEYESTISELPDRVTFEARDKIIDVQVKVFSKKNEG